MRKPKKRLPEILLGRWPEWMSKEERVEAVRLVNEKTTDELVQMLIYLRREHNDLQLVVMEALKGHEG